MRLQNGATARRDELRGCDGTDANGDLIPLTLICLNRPITLCNVFWHDGCMLRAAESTRAPGSVQRLAPEVVTNRSHPNKSYVRTGPYGGPLTPADLPPANTRRWVERRKSVVIAAVEAGLISLEDACRRYSLSTEELAAWRLALKEFGPAGLRSTKIQRYRKPGTLQK